MPHTQQDGLVVGKVTDHRFEKAVKAPASMGTESKPIAHWYAVDAHGAATLCTCEEDARETAAESAQMFPNCAPYTAVQLAPVSAPTSHPIPTGATGEAVKRLRDAIEGECGGNWISEKQAAAVLAHLGISAPAAGDALAVEDQQHLNWMIAEECRIETLTLGNGSRYRVHWPDVDEHQAEWFFSPGGAIRAAIAQQSQRKEA